MNVQKSNLLKYDISLPSVVNIQKNKLFVYLSKFFEKDYVNVTNSNLNDKTNSDKLKYLVKQEQ